MHAPLGVRPVTGYVASARGALFIGVAEMEQRRKPFSLDGAEFFAA